MTKPGRDYPSDGADSQGVMRVTDAQAVQLANSLSVAALISRVATYRREKSARL